MKEFTQKHQRVLDYIRRCVDDGVPPTVREICDSLGIKSTSTGHKYLRELEEMGYITMGGNRNRCIRLVGRQEEKAVQVPLLGTVAAGMPILAVESLEGYVPFAAGRYDPSELFALRVKGESMIEVGHHHCPAHSGGGKRTDCRCHCRGRGHGQDLLQGEGTFPSAAGKQHHGTHHCYRGGDPRQGDLGGAQLRIAFSVKRPGFRRGVCFVGKGRKLADRAGLELMQLCKMRKNPRPGNPPAWRNPRNFSKRRHRHYRRRQKRDIIVRYGKTESF